MTAFRGVQIARAVTSLSWSGLAARSSFSNLQSLAMNSARSYGTSRFRRFGVLAKARGVTSGEVNVGSLTRKRTVNVEDRLLDRIDPSNQLDRLSRYLWHKDRLAALRGQWMYFYTDLKTQVGHGLAGVNINDGQTDREIKVDELDERFITDEVLGRMYLADGNRLIGRLLR